MSKYTYHTKYFEYALSISPIILGHLIVPPLSFFTGNESPPKEVYEFYVKYIIPDFLLDFNFVYSLLIDSDINKRQIEQWLSYMFVHGNYLHMVSNLINAIHHGYLVYCEFGLLGFYVCFIFGGICAVIPSSLHNEQEKTFVKGCEALLSSYGDPFVPNSLKNYWHTFCKNVAPISTIALPSKTCGSSGAVCALMGCELGLLIRDVVAIVSVEVNKRSVTKVSRLLSPETIIQKESILTSILKCIFKDENIFNKTFQICCTMSYLNSEIYQIYNFATPNKSSSGGNSWGQWLKSSRIGHSAHVQGMFFGTAFAALFAPRWPQYMHRCY